MGGGGWEQISRFKQVPCYNRSPEMAGAGVLMHGCSLPPLSEATLMGHASI